MIIKFILLILILLCLIVLNIKEHFHGPFGCQRLDIAPLWYSWKTEHPKIKKKLIDNVKGFCYNNRDSNCGTGCWDHMLAKERGYFRPCDRVFACCKRLHNMLKDTSKTNDEVWKKLEGTACENAHPRPVST